MPLENATNIAELVITNPASGDGAGTTDDHVKMIKKSVKNSFSGFTGSENVGLSEAKINALPGAISSIADALGNYCLPHLEKKGSIKPWPTGYAAIPAGWQLADGTNGTPDLRGLAVIGANGSTYIDGQNYGSATVNSGPAGGHDHGGETDGHALTEPEMPPHDHDLDNHEAAGSFLDKVGGGAGAGEGVAYKTKTAGGGLPHKHGLQSEDDHEHVVSTIQPSKALSWIIKTTEPSASGIASAIATAMTAAGLA